MRNNQPVSGREYPFPVGKTLVSVTDLKGRITYCNHAFVEVSGYEEDELLGQPHNLVRHPDMPEEAFRDLWATIEQGLPWRGPVKNRRKNGDHYWVLANATPMKDGDRITGYLSVRTPCPRTLVEVADKAYAQMRAEQAAGRRKLVLRRGQFRRADLTGRLLQALRPGPLTWQYLLQLPVTAALLMAAWWLPPAGAVAAALPLTGLAWWLARRHALAPYALMLDDARHLGAGDLTHEVAVQDSGLAGALQQALGQMAANLRSVVLDARADIEALNQRVHAIGAGNQNLAARTENQAASLEQTAASMEQITGTVAHTAASAQRGAELAREAAEVARSSQQSVSAVAQSMADIQAASHRISDMIHVVEGVAFQTNILALNASVEAARAGESGKGFAVVAEEVRELAGRAAEAAREIRRLVAASAECVASGDQQTQAARERVDAALSSVASVSEVLEGISQATREQQAGIAQINQAMAHMDGMTQQNAAMVDEITQATQRMLAQVELVSTSTRLFRLQRGEKTVSERDAVALRRAAKGGEDPSD